MNSLFDANALLQNLVLTSPRIAAAFLILPILSKDDAPVLVRNAIYVTLALAAAPLLNTAARVPVGFVPWAGIIVKELLVGAIIGFSFASVLWAVSMAGDMIDTKIGTNMASVLDPLAGHQTSLTGALLGRFAGYLFFALGGLTIFLDVLLGSYQLWPVQAPFPSLTMKSIDYFAHTLGSMIALAFLLAAPAMILMSMVDLALGVMNRYAPQLNVLPITMALKAWSASAILILGLAAFVAVLTRSFDRSRGLLQSLQGVFG